MDHDLTLFEPVSHGSLLRPLEDHLPDILYVCALNETSVARLSATRSQPTYETPSQDNLPRENLLISF